MTTQDFKLHELLKRDLLRQRSLLHPEHAKAINPCRLWLGLCSPRFIPVLLYRLSYKFLQMKLGVLARFFSMLNVILFGIEITPRCKIGPGLFLPHTQSTVIGALSIGENAVIYHGVTLGAKCLNFSYDALHRPVIGDNVTIGSGAKVLGGVVIANNVSIGANSVLLKSVSMNQVVAGIPARVITDNKKEIKVS